MTEAATASRLAERAERSYVQSRQELHRRTDRLFAVLMLLQWLAGILVAVIISPRAWEGRQSAVHSHVWAALILGGLLSSAPVALALLRPGAPVTRYVIASAQMLWSGLFIHLTGGRIETHFHVFGSLAFLGFYRDWRVYVPATVLVAGDHVLRQFFWPESVFGMAAPEWWRFLEHAGWVVFEDTFMIIACIQGARDMRNVAFQRATAEEASDREREKSSALDKALEELKRSHDQLIRSEKLAAVGKLAASVGHELRNPLAAVRNAHTYIAKRVTDAGTADARMTQFIGVVDRELNSCTRIISDLLDFARERAPSLNPCPLKPLVDEAFSLVPQRANVRIVNEVPASLPVPNLDKDQFRQVVINLVQNAVESIPMEHPGEVRVQAEGGGALPYVVRVVDNGAGIAPEAVANLFQPLYTTKTKGTGLGLAIVQGVVNRHGGTIRAESQPGKGTAFVIELPAAPVNPAVLEEMPRARAESLAGR